MPASVFVESGISSSLGVTANQPYLIVLPTNWRKGVSYPIIIFSHGAGGVGSSGSAGPDGDGGTYAALHFMASHGCIVFHTNEESAFSWGTDAVMTSIQAQIDYLVANYGGDPNRVGLMGGSMGSMASLKFIYRNPTVAKAYCGFLLCHNMTQIYTSNLSGLRAGLGTAYGVTFPTPLPATADPHIQYLNTPAPIPVLGYYDPNDILTIPTNAVEFARIQASLKTDFTYVSAPTALGHSPQTIAFWITTYRDQILAFMRKNLSF